MAREANAGGVLIAEWLVYLWVPPNSLVLPHASLADVFPNTVGVPSLDMYAANSGCLYLTIHYSSQ